MMWDPETGALAVPRPEVELALRDPEHMRLLKIAASLVDAYHCVPEADYSPGGRFERGLTKAVARDDSAGCVMGSVVDEDGFPNFHVLAIKINE